VEKFTTRSIQKHVYEDLHYNIIITENLKHKNSTYGHRYTMKLSKLRFRYTLTNVEICPHGKKDYEHVRK
jgi:DNA-binding MltR family transcriptional regulator